MIITKVQGGLGNQMFQYAIGRNIAFLNNTSIKIDADFQKKSKYKKNTREYKLDCFNITGEKVSNEDLDFIGIPNMNSHDIRSKIKRKIFKYRENKKNIKQKKYVKQSKFNFQSQILELKDNIYLEGTWQTEKNFKSIENIIKKEFTLKNQISSTGKNILDTINTTESVSIHIRRGDYAENEEFREYYGLCSLQYYTNAIIKIQEKIKNPYFFIFSDDIEWAKKNLKIKSPTTFVSDNNLSDCEEMIIMSKCKDNIIANSTFSWWAAWLNENPNKNIIAPKIWLNNSPHNTDDICPQSWIRI